MSERERETPTAHALPERCQSTLVQCQVWMERHQLWLRKEAAYVVLSAKISVVWLFLLIGALENTVSAPKRSQKIFVSHAHHMLWDFPDFGGKLPFLRKTSTPKNPCYVA